jgi:two-component system sensor histidine kinase KdpD
MASVSPDRSLRAPRWWPAALVWLGAAVILFAVDESLALANEALLLVLCTAVGSLWLRPVASTTICAVAILAFNFAFVPPRGTLSVELRDDTLLLLTMFCVSWIVTLLMARLRRLANEQERHARRIDQLHTLGEQLRETDAPGDQAGQLQAALAELTGHPATLLLPDPAGADAPSLLGPASPDEATGLGLSMRDSMAMGPGTGRYEEQPAWYLPMRGRESSPGAALLRLDATHAIDPAARAHAQALCDQMGLALERAAARRTAAAAREAAQAQALRSTVLAAIAHDHRTPLATILGAASSLHDQDDRLGPEQRRRLATTIVDEAAHLARLTENALQLARLGAPGLELELDWESAEEIVGAVARRLRQRHGADRITTRLDAGLPLMRCDAVLMVQLLDNLLDNALKYGGRGAAVEVDVRRAAGRLVFTVADRGPGVPAAERERIFEIFRRGDTPPQAPESDAPRGAGVGLAVCRAIARAHGGEVAYRVRDGGGSLFEVALPLPEPDRAPVFPQTEAHTETPAPPGIGPQ